tara:strand:- start:1961 stop:2458 length:498 start_codon:yes stop_codon:yes gene_type:complete
LTNISYIWRDSNTIPTADVVEFNGGARPDDSGSITNVDVSLISAVSVNPKPKGQLDEIQDTGFSSLTWKITGAISLSSGIPVIIKEWLLEDKTTATRPFGRFGVSLTDFPTHNVHPNGDRGCIITDWTWIRGGEVNGMAAFTCTIRFNSNLAGLNSSGNFDWTGA